MDFTEYVWAADNTSVTATRICRNNPAHIETETVDTIKETTQSPTQNEIGHLRYSALFTNEAFMMQEKEDDIPALNSMNTLFLPGFLTTIEAEAFAGISAEAIILPDNCNTIGPKAFANCKKLRYICIPNGAEIPADAFESSPNVVIYRK